MEAVASAGGRSSALWVQLLQARAYATAQDRAAAPEEHWLQYQRVLGSDVEGPDWALTDGTSAREEQLAREELAEEVALQLGCVDRCADKARLEWIRKSEGTVAWREQLEQGRHFLRLCMRAWREVADGVRARAAKWEQRWRGAEAGSGDCVLARRLAVGDGEGAAPRWHAAEAWAVRVMLTWMRLVRASAVMAARRRSPVWQEVQQRAREEAASVRFAGSEGYRHVVGQRFTWREEEEEARATGATSGAAVILARRREREDEEEEEERRGRERTQVLFV